jgi:hypothetical protein
VPINILYCEGGKGSPDIRVLSHLCPPGCLVEPIGSKLGKTAPTYPKYHFKGTFMTFSLSTARSRFFRLGSLKEAQQRGQR